MTAAAMTTLEDRLPYVRKVRGRLFWEGTGERLKLGFVSMPLGLDGPEAREAARKRYQAYLVARGTAKRTSSWPKGSLGSFYDNSRHTAWWRRKSPRTREDYTRAWDIILALRPLFPTKLLTRIAPADWEDVQAAIEAARSVNERYRSVKAMRALFQYAEDGGKIAKSPCKTLTNPQAPGRTQIWLGAEVDVLIRTAVREGYAGMSLALRLAWDTMFSPVDVWTLALDRVKRDRGGVYVERPRTKTSKRAFGDLSADTVHALIWYIAGLGVTLAPSAPIIRQRNGHAYRSKDTFGDDFRAVRVAAFKDDRRQFLDLRRSASVEADLGGADAETRGELLANLLATSKFLEDTYTPATVAKARVVAKQRQAGRELLKAEAERVRSA